MADDLDRALNNVLDAGKVAGRILNKNKDNADLIDDMHELISHMGLAVNALRREIRTR